MRPYANKLPICIAVCSFILFHTSYSQITAPSSVCTNAPVNFTTPVAGHASYVWVFDTVDINQVPGTFSGTPVTGLATPTYATMNNDGGTWYSFVTNYNNNTVVRLNYGNNPNSAPTSTNLGTFGNGGLIEGIDVVKDPVSNNWYGFVVNNTDLVRLDFGSSLANTPSSTVMSFAANNNLAWPHQFGIGKYGNQWVGFAANRNGGMTRFDFGTNIASTPTPVKLPLSGGIANPCNYALYNDGSNWHMLITNLLNATVTRLSFGSNIQNNTPAAVSLGNPGNYLNLPRGVCIVADCNQLYTYILNESGNMTRLNFNNDITSTPVATSLGSSGVGAQNCLITYTYNGKRRLLMVSYSNSNIYRTDLITYPASSQVKYYTPLATHTFTQPGTYNVTLHIDRGCGDGVEAYCTSIQVGNGLILKDTNVCKGDTVVLDAGMAGGTSYTWNTGAATSSIKVTTAGTYWVNITGSLCASSDTANVSVTPLPEVDLGNDTAFCGALSIVLQNLDTVSSVAKYLWNTGDTAAKITVNNIGMYWVAVTDSGCSNSDTMNIVIGNLPIAIAGNDTAVCPGDSIQLHGLGGNTYKWSSTGNTGFSKSDTSSPKVKILGPTTLTLTVLKDGCSDTDKLNIKVVSIDSFGVSPENPKVCIGDNIELSGYGGDNYLWWEENSSNTQSEQDISVNPAEDVTYYVLISESTCNYSDTLSVNIRAIPVPVVTVSKSNDIECSKSNAVLTAVGADSYEWSPSVVILDSSAASVRVMPDKETVFTVIGTNENTCSDTERITVKRNDESMVKIIQPDAFTPDNNGINDCYKISILENINKFEFAIYNRWGNEVFHTNTYGDCWDGTYNGVAQSTGTYYFFYKANSYNCEWFNKGSVHLLR